MRTFTVDLANALPNANTFVSVGLLGLFDPPLPLRERAYFQFFPFDRQADGLGLSASNYGRLSTGN